MKKIILISLSVLTLTTFSAFGCNNKRSGETKPTDEAQISPVKRSEIKGIPFPEGSQTFTTEVKGVTKIVLPDDVFFVVKDEAGQVYRLSEIAAKCRCTQEAGCSLTKIDDKFSCSMGKNCNDCSMTVTDLEKNKPVYVLGVMNENSTGFLGSEDSFLTVTSIKDRQYGITADFFECREVKEAIDKLCGLVYGEDIPDFIKNNSYEIPEDYTLAVFNFFGNTVLFPLPKNYEEIAQKGLKTVDFEKAKGSCSCENGAQGCELKSDYIVKYCNAGNCTSCTMSITQF